MTPASLQIALEAERELNLETACQMVTQACQEAPRDRATLLNGARILTGRRCQENLPRALHQVLRANPWDFEVCEILAEADPGYAVQITREIQSARLLQDAPAGTRRATYDAISHGRDRSLRKIIHSEPETVDRLERFHREWTDAQIRRQMHMVLGSDGRQRRTFKVTKGQVPELWEMHQEVARRLGISKVPELFLVDDDEPNGAAYGISDPVIFITSGLYKLLANEHGTLIEEEVMFVLGHEYGHKILQHSLIRAAAEDMAKNSAFWGTALDGLGRMFGTPFLQEGGFGNFLGLLLGGYMIDKGKGKSEKAARLLMEIGTTQQFFEYSCDRVGSIAAGSTEAGIQTLMKLSDINFNQSPFEEMGIPVEFDFEEYLRQYDEAWRRLDIADETELLRSHPHVFFRIRSLQAWQLSKGYFDQFGGRRASPTGPFQPCTACQQRRGVIPYEVRDLWGNLKGVLCQPCSVEW